MYQRTIDVGAAVIDRSACAKGDRQYQWVVALESSIGVEVSDSPAVLRRVIDRSGV